MNLLLLLLNSLVELHNLILHLLRLLKVIFVLVEAHIRHFELVVHFGFDAFRDAIEFSHLVVNKFN